MRGLWLRLFVALLAATLVGMLVLQVAFLFWSSAAMSAMRRLALRTAASELAAGVDAKGVDATLLVQRLASEHQVKLTLVRADGSLLSSDTTALTLPTLGASAQGLVQDGSFEHAYVRFGDWRSWRLALATRQRADGLDAAFALERDFLIVLAATTAAILVLALLFLRRIVLQPLARMTELVGKQDQLALSRFATPFDELGRLSRAIIAMSQEIGDDRQKIRWQLEELKATNQRLADAQQELIRAERLAVVGQLAAGLAHEVGNPLTVLSGFVDLLRDDTLPAADRRAALERMAKELTRIQATVRELLVFSRAGRASAGSGEVGTALEHVHSLLVPQAKLRGVRLEMPPPSERLEVPIDGDRLTQLLLNLLLNAADAVAGKGAIRVAVEGSEAEVVIDVDDTGPGVPAEERARIFQPFYTTKPAGSGTGLGLPVCERIVVDADGDIQVLDSPLGGARFRVRLPRLRAVAPHSGADSS